VPRIFNPLPTCQEEWNYFKSNPNLDLVSEIKGFKVDEIEVLQLAANGILFELSSYLSIGADLLGGQIYPKTYFYKLFTVSHIKHECTETQF